MTHQASVAYCILPHLLSFAQMVKAYSPYDNESASDDPSEIVKAPDLYHNRRAMHWVSVIIRSLYVSDLIG
jgi:hypothetical protein